MIIYIRRPFAHLFLIPNPWFLIFPMRGHETEIKLKVANPRATKRKLAELGFAATGPRRFERNLLFDFPDLRLRKARSALRLRFEKDRNLMTYKGAPLNHSGYKVRREIETKVEDGRQVREAFEALGLREMFRYEKYRTTYHQPLNSIDRNTKRADSSGEVVFDQTPIGDFLELEGPKRWIDSVARRLGYTRNDYITQSYAALYLARCVERGVKPGNMVFGKRR